MSTESVPGTARGAGAARDPRVSVAVVTRDVSPALLRPLDVRPEVAHVH
ncbi:hypothetical protein AB0950_11380 [Streptomyces sp. NPDC007189]